MAASIVPDSYFKNEKILIKYERNSRNCSMTPKKEDEFDDQSKELRSCNQEDKKKIGLFKLLIKLPPIEKKIAQEDEKQIASLVDEKPESRTWNFRPRRKVNFKYVSSESEKGKKREFTNSLTREEIEEDYIYLMGKPPRRTKKRVC